MKIVNKYIIAIAGALTLGSCVDLDQSPYESIAVGRTFKNIRDIELWRNGMYVKLRNQVYGEYMLYNDIQGDLINALRSHYAEGYGPIHRWETLNSSHSGFNSIWSGAYSLISNANVALEGQANITPKNDAERLQLNLYIGEIHLARAYMYTRLVTSFCKIYDPATASSDLGVPLEKVYNVKTQNKRATVQEVYDFILEDIAKAEKLLNLKDANGAMIQLPWEMPQPQPQPRPGAEVFTIDAAKALKARVLLFMGRWKEAQEVAESLLANYPLAQNASTLQDIWYKDNGQESITQLFVSIQDQLPSENSIYAALTEGNYSPQFIPSQWVVDLYEDTDYRKAVYFKKTDVRIGFGSTKVPNIQIINKFPGNPTLQSGSEPRYAHAPKVFRIAEMYLIASEAAFKKGDETKAREHLNTLRQARGLSAVTASGNALWEEIKNERLRELAFEGFRLLDLKRWKEPVIRKEPQQQAMSILSKTPVNQFYELNRSADDFKFVWPIPAWDKKHGELQQNPGW
ncbi:RagB/SusD family nutrient uptake outer membrane protein [Capnocytophaga sp.]|uniref:RagB/SusD family nutrient uptake outer membrane protein n=1 Tax=Capnocytophaga sp. TaxID=44737 RepID=UPI0026DB3B48|nr:RagB/SusD family nutrient uptake outer membrane protein [Capnocytophaga sp.]MDO5105039.1 RagB/SusD family nutrient uptake outer membrane protein [Capnocytophaga sp.]